MLPELSSWGFHSRCSKFERSCRKRGTSVWKNTYQVVASSLAKGETPGWGEDQERTGWERALPVRNCFFKAFLWVPLFIQIFGSVYHYQKQEGRGSCELFLLWACSPSATLGDQLPPESLHKDSGYKQNSSLENKVSAPHFVLPIPQTVSSSVSRPPWGPGVW